ncbi:transcriptional regulator [Subtercola boreus]|uniref:Transcriptional regulator n=1 Tax=Subtercola boreus TaxID=120213 RepID=A0A3E0VGN0_9MICO|nr:LacI family DNA-binding transcriptional regulator [Subtercola boreus]RFA09072.1 transcriptional regulator [Subtercola boreus]TQL53925.1 LacI family transcriptional regulator [Subtercola boreus]
MKRVATISDVAEAAGVSRQTVSNVLNTPGIVRPDTRERVEEVIARLAYRPHASARRLRTRKSSTIGIRLDPMTDGISGSVLDRFLHALTEQAAGRGLRILIFTADSPEDEITQFGRLLDGADVDAFVLTSTFYGDPRTEWLIENGHSFVTFGRPWGIDDMTDARHLWVDVDGSAGLRASTGHALATGARRVGYIGWPPGSGTGDDRRRGWQAQMAAAGITDPALLEALQVSASDTVVAGGQAMLELRRRVPDLEAVVCASDSLALGALMNNPERLPVFGYDNTPVAAAVGLTSVEQPLAEVAAAVLELLHGVGAEGAGSAEGAGAAGSTDGVGAAPGAAGGGAAAVDASPTDPRHRLITPRLVVRELLVPGWLPDPR